MTQDVVGSHKKAIIHHDNIRNIGCTRIHINKLCTVK